jgi:putative acetyltransferase
MTVNFQASLQKMRAGQNSLQTVGRERKEDDTMTSEIDIRSETNEDIGAIAEVTVAAFQTLEISNHTEQFIIEALRAAKVLTVSLVAEVDGRVVGHIAFSPVTISDGTQGWYGLGPVSVLPEYQRQGIGKALIHEGLTRLKRMQARGCCLVGHPEYYKKFGFDNLSELVHKGVPPEVFLALSFDGKSPRGTVTFHAGFKADGQQERPGDALQHARRSSLPGPLEK